MLARLESGAEEMDKAPVSMAELIEELVTDADFEGSGTQLQRSSSFRIRKLFLCWEQGNLLRSAVENVLRNAVRHTAENTEVMVTLHVHNVGNRLSVP